MNRSPGQNRGRPRQYGPERKSERNKGYRQRLKATWKDSPCSVARCWDLMWPGSDLCSKHHVRRQRYGSPLAGRIAWLDFKRMRFRVRSIRRRMDPALLKIAVNACQKLVVEPGQTEPAGRLRSKSSKYRVAIEVWRLAHPPKHLYSRSAQPVTAVEVFDAVVASWLCATIPGALTKGYRRAPIPKFDTTDSIAMAVGHAVLRLRGKAEAHATRPTSVVAVKTLGRRLVNALAPIMCLMERDARKSIVRGQGMMTKRRRKREKRVPPPKPHATLDPPVFHFHFTQGEPE